MAVVQKIDSNVTALRYALESSLGALPSTPIWHLLEPNSYADFGGQPTSVARNPINPSRQRRKGTITDLDVSGGFNMDVTQENLQDLLPGYLFANVREKASEAVTAVNATSKKFSVASTAGFVVGSLVWGKGFTEAANNGLKKVTGIDADTSITLDGSPATEATASGTLFIIGHEFTAGQVDIVVSGALPRLNRLSGSTDFTTFGLIPGEWVFIGGDLAAEKFKDASAANNGFKRVRSVTATGITFDKSDMTMVVDDGSSKTIRVYFGKSVIKNESAQSSIVRKTFQLERTLGASDMSQLAQIQAEYLKGMVPNELAINMPSASLLTADFSFVGSAVEYVEGTTASPLKGGTRLALGAGEAYNTSSDFSRIRLSRVENSNEAPSPLFAFSQEITLNLSNNINPNKALGFLGSFDLTAGVIQVGGSITSYFSDVNAIKAVQENASITLDFIVVKGGSGAKHGFATDLPLLTLGDGRVTIEQDSPITLPLTMDAVSGVDVDSGLDHTILFTYFDYLPNAADI